MSMENLKEYLKYYFLEDYLFKEISKNFLERHYLEREEFFTIIIWKSNRAKNKYKTESRLKVNAANIKNTTSKLFRVIDKNKEKRIETMKEMVAAVQQLSGVGLPVASAILAVCHPEDFTIVDYRAKASLIKLLNNKDAMTDKEILIDIKRRFGADPANSRSAYVKYCICCWQKAKELNISLRDFDRALFGMDFYEGRHGLRELAVDFSNITS